MVGGDTAGRRRVRRSVRVLTAGIITAASCLFVAVAVAWGRWVPAAALVCAVGAVLASRILYQEIVDTRARAAVERGRQAAAYQREIEETRRLQRAVVEGLSASLRARDDALCIQTARTRAADARAGVAEARAEREAARALQAEALRDREADRRRAAQDRLASVLDEVFGTRLYDLDRDNAQRSGVGDVIGLHSRDSGTKAS